MHRIAAAEVPHRARLPLEIYPISAGIKGGLAGSVAMAALAILYGVMSHGSVWYPINLLGGVVYADTQMSTAWLTQFHIELFAVATVLHLTGSILVGLLYGAVLPMLPRRPILLGGFLRRLLGPVCFTPFSESLIRFSMRESTGGGSLLPRSRLELLPGFWSCGRCVYLPGSIRLLHGPAWKLPE